MNSGKNRENKVLIEPYCMHARVLLDGFPIKMGLQDNFDGLVLATFMFQYCRFNGICTMVISYPVNFLGFEKGFGQGRK